MRIYSLVNWRFASWSVEFIPKSEAQIGSGVDFDAFHIPTTTTETVVCSIIYMVIVELREIRGTGSAVRVSLVGCLIF